MSEALRLTVEEIQPSPNVVQGVGSLATREHLGLVHSETLVPIFEPLEIDVATAISNGQTNRQIARSLDIAPYDVKGARWSAMKKVNSNGSASILVDRMIRLSAIPIEVNPDEEALANITGFDYKMLRFYAVGGSNHKAAKQTGAPLKAIEKYHDKLLEKVGAWSRAHAVRRSYELGIRKIRPVHYRSLLQ